MSLRKSYKSNVDEDMFNFSDDENTTTTTSDFDSESNTSTYPSRYSTPPRSNLASSTRTVSKHPKSVGKTLEKMLYQKAQMKKNDQILQNEKSSTSKYKEIADSHLSLYYGLDDEESNDTSTTSPCLSPKHVDKESANNEDTGGLQSTNNTMRQLSSSSTVFESDVIKKLKSMTKGSQSSCSTSSSITDEEYQQTAKCKPFASEIKPKSSYSTSPCSKPIAGSSTCSGKNFSMSQSYGKRVLPTRSVKPVGSSPVSIGKKISFLSTSRKTIIPASPDVGDSTEKSTIYFNPGQCSTPIRKTKNAPSPMPKYNRDRAVKQSKTKYFGEMDKTKTSLRNMQLNHHDDSSDDGTTDDGKTSCIESSQSSNQLHDVASSLSNISSIRRSTAEDDIEFISIGSDVSMNTTSTDMRSNLMNMASITSYSDESLNDEDDLDDDLENGDLLMATPAPERAEDVNIDDQYRIGKQITAYCKAMEAKKVINTAKRKLTAAKNRLMVMERQAEKGILPKVAKQERTKKRRGRPRKRENEIEKNSQDCNNVDKHSTPLPKKSPNTDKQDDCNDQDNLQLEQNNTITGNSKIPDNQSNQVNKDQTEIEDNNDKLMNSSGDMDSSKCYDQLSNQVYQNLHQNHSGNVDQQHYSNVASGSKLTSPTATQIPWNVSPQSVNAKSLQQISPKTSAAHLSPFSNNLSTDTSPNTPTHKSPTNDKGRKPEMHSLNMPASIYPYNKQLVAIGKHQDYLKRMQSNETPRQNMLLQHQRQPRMAQPFHPHMHHDMMQRSPRCNFMPTSYGRTLNSQQQYDIYNANIMHRFTSNTSPMFSPNSPNGYRFGSMTNSPTQHRSLKKQKLLQKNMQAPILNPQILQNGMHPIQNNEDVHNTSNVFEEITTEENKSNGEDVVKLKIDFDNEANDLNKSSLCETNSQSNDDEDSTAAYTCTKVDKMSKSESWDVNLPPDLHEIQKPQQSILGSISRLRLSSGIPEQVELPEESDSKSSTIDDIQDGLDTASEANNMIQGLQYTSSQEAQNISSIGDDSQNSNMDTMKYNQLDGIRKQLDTIQGGERMTPDFQGLSVFKSDSSMSINGQPSRVYQHHRNMPMYPMPNPIVDQFKRPLPSPLPSCSLTERQRQIGNELLSRDVMRTPANMNLGANQWQYGKCRMNNIRKQTPRRIAIAHMPQPPQPKITPVKRSPIKRKSSEMGGIKISLMLKSRRIAKPPEDLHPPANSPVVRNKDEEDSHSYPVNYKLLFTNMSRIIRLNNQSKNVIVQSSESAATLSNSVIGSASNISMCNDSGIRTSASCMSLMDDSSPSCTTFQRPTSLMNPSCGELSTIESPTARPCQPLPPSVADQSDSGDIDTSFGSQSFDEELRDVAQVQPVNRITEPVTLDTIESCDLTPDAMPELYMQSNSLLQLERGVEEAAPRRFISDTAAGLANVPAMAAMDDLNLRMLLEEKINGCLTKSGKVKRSIILDSNYPLNIDSYIDGTDEEGKDKLVYILSKKGLPALKPIVSSITNTLDPHIQANDSFQLDQSTLTSTQQFVGQLGRAKPNIAYKPIFETNLAPYTPLSELDMRQLQLENSVSRSLNTSKTTTPATHDNNTSSNSKPMLDSNEIIPYTGITKPAVSSMFANKRVKPMGRRMEFFQILDVPNSKSACFIGKDALHKQFESSMWNSFSTRLVNGLTSVITEPNGQIFLERLNYKNAITTKDSEILCYELSEVSDSPYDSQSDSATDSASEGEYQAAEKAKALKKNKSKQISRRKCLSNLDKQRRRAIRKRRHNLLRSAEKAKRCVYENFPVPTVAPIPVSSSLSPIDQTDVSTGSDKTDAFVIRNQEDYDAQMLRIAREFNESEQTVIGPVKGVYDLEVPAEIEIQELEKMVLDNYSQYLAGSSEELAAQNSLVARQYGYNSASRRAMDCHDAYVYQLIKEMQFGNDVEGNDVVFSFWSSFNGFK